MKTFYIVLLLAFLLHGCAGGRHQTNPTTGSVEKLIKKYNRTPADTAALRRVVESYQLLNRQYLAEIDELKYRNTAESWEQAGNLYSKMQELNLTTLKTEELAGILAPGDYLAEIASARQTAAGLYYEKAMDQLQVNYWRDARKAYSNLLRVRDLAKNYQDVNNLLKQAKEAGTINILVRPLRSEGIFVDNRSNQNEGRRLADQLVRDLNGTWNSQSWYRAFSNGRYRGNEEDADWVAEPVWTSWKQSPLQYNTFKRTVTKQKETGKDSLRRPVFTNISAVITIKEVTLNAEGILELRVSDLANNGNSSRTSWRETYVWKQTTASYTGDPDALSNEDWNLVRAEKQRTPDDDYMQLQLLQRIYPDMFRWLKQKADL